MQGLKQQGLIAISTIALSAILIIWALLAGQSSIKALEQKVATKQQENARIQQLAKQLQNAKAAVSPSDTSIGIITLLPWLEKTIAKQQLQTQLVQIKPIDVLSGQTYRESAAVFLQGISFIQAIELIDSLENNREIQIIKANIKRMPNTNQQGVTLNLDIGLI